MNELIGFKDLTKTDVRDGLRELYRGYLENLRRTDSRITRLPDVQALLAHIDHNGLPPLARSASPQPEAEAECPFGADCDLTTAYLAGQARGKESGQARDAEIRAFEAGWRTCANWMERDDLIADIGSPCYIADRNAALAAQRGEQGDGGEQ